MHNLPTDPQVAFTRGRLDAYQVLHREFGPDVPEGVFDAVLTTLAAVTGAARAAYAAGAAKSAFDFGRPQLAKLVLDAVVELMAGRGGEVR